jgi:hypothetical protein
MQGAGRSMVEEDQRKKDYMDEKRRNAREDEVEARRAKRALAEQLRQEQREDKQYSRRRADQTADRDLEWKRGAPERETNQRYMDWMMSRPSGGGGSGGGSSRPVSVTSESLLAKMGFQNKEELYKSGDEQAITAYESLLGTKLAPEELDDLNNRLSGLASRRRGAQSILSRQDDGMMYFDTGAPNQVRNSEVMKQADLQSRVPTTR